MKPRHVILGIAVVLYVVVFPALTSTELQYTLQPDSQVLQGNGKGKGPKCKTEPICDPNQCQQLVCDEHPNNPCRACHCDPIPGCVPDGEPL